MKNCDHFYELRSGKAICTLCGMTLTKAEVIQKVIVNTYEIQETQERIIGALRKL